MNNCPKCVHLWHVLGRYILSPALSLAGCEGWPSTKPQQQGGGQPHLLPILAVRCVTAHSVPQDSHKAENRDSTHGCVLGMWLDLVPFLPLPLFLHTRAGPAFGAQMRMVWWKAWAARSSEKRRGDIFSWSNWQCPTVIAHTRCKFA